MNEDEKDEVVLPPPYDWRTNEDLLTFPRPQQHVNTTTPPISSTTSLPRILCLHGFRQTSQNFRGRTSALRKRLKHAAELIYIDAPHKLPLIYQNKELSSDQTPVAEVSAERNKTTNPENSNTSEVRRFRKGWLVTPEQYNTAVHVEDIDDQQYQKQTAGWEESLALLENALTTQGPFDGVLGFSQGAAVAAVLAALECQRPVNARRFKFVIICSGYRSAVPEHRDCLESWKQSGGVPMPSLHIYGASQLDRQISQLDSEGLVESFIEQDKMVIRHDSGHLIPSSREITFQISEFIKSACIDR